MATAKKLPSGSWRCQVYSHTEELVQPDGSIKRKRIYKSFTNDIPGPKGKRLAEQAASSWAAEKESANSVQNITFGEALDRYIEAQSHSPKTVRNSHGLISAVLRVYRHNFAHNTALPKKVRPDIYVPSDEEIRRLLSAVSNNDVKLPILLASFAPMRRGEIYALSSEDIAENIVHVCKTWW